MSNCSPCNTSSSTNCVSSRNPCPSYPDARCVVYTGPNLSCINVTTNQRLDNILSTLNTVICNINSRVEIQDEGVGIGSVTTINFVGDGVVATRSGDVATVTITGGGGGSETWQDTLINGSTLIQNNAVDGGGFVFAFGNTNMVLDGTLQYIDGNQASAFVLTSDAFGNATWQAVITPDLQAVTDVGERADNNINLHPVGVPLSNSLTAKMRSVAAGDSITITNTENIAVGSNISISRNRNLASGINLTINGDDNHVSGRGNSCQINESLLAGRNNTAPQSVSPYAFANILLGISNQSDVIARGAMAAGGANYVNNDFAISIGYNNSSIAKGGVAAGWATSVKTAGEFSIGAAITGVSGLEADRGTAQTSFVTFSEPFVGLGSDRVLTIASCRDSNGNYQPGCETFGLWYYEVEDLSVHYVEGRFQGITADGDICIYTINTYFKNVGGTITAGTLNFTEVFKDVAFTDMTGVVLTFAIVTGNVNSLLISFTNPGSNPIANYTCFCKINKSKWFN